MDAAAIAKAVQSEIERQQADVVYNDLSVEELEGVVQHLTARLELCKEALAAKQGEKKPEAKKVAQKSEGTWPDLPWTDRTPRRPRARRPPPPCVLRCGLPAPPRAPASLQQHGPTLRRTRIRTRTRALARTLALTHRAAKTGKQDAQKIHDYIVSQCKVSSRVRVRVRVRVGARGRVGGRVKKIHDYIVSQCKARSASGSGIGVGVAS